MAVMIAAEKVEQSITHRPNSYVPQTGPVHEQIVAVAHKAIYSLATSVFAERLVAPHLESRRCISSH